MGTNYDRSFMEMKGSRIIPSKLRHSLIVSFRCASINDCSPKRYEGNWELDMVKNTVCNVMLKSQSCC